MFNKITTFNESKRLTKHISCDCKCIFDVRKCNWNQRWKLNKCHGECKILMKHCVSKEDYAWSPSTSASECDKHCDIDEYLRNCTFTKSITVDLVITCDEIVETPETVLINSHDKEAAYKVIIIFCTIFY